MRSQDVIREISGRTGLTQEQVRDVLAAQADVVLDALRKGDRVPVAGIGRLDARWAPPRTLRSISDYRKVAIDGRFVARFRVARRVRDAVSSRTPQHWRDPRHQSAWRVAETLLGDLALYHRDRAPKALPADDAAADAACRDAFGDAWGQARRAWEAQVPLEVRAQADHLLRGARARWG